MWTVIGPGTWNDVRKGTWRTLVRDIWRIGSRGLGDRLDIGVTGGMIYMILGSAQTRVTGEVEATGRSRSWNENLILEVQQSAGNLVLRTIFIGD